MDDRKRAFIREVSGQLGGKKELSGLAWSDLPDAADVNASFASVFLGRFPAKATGKHATLFNNSISLLSVHKKTLCWLMQNNFVFRPASTLPLLLAQCVSCTTKQENFSCMIFSKAQQHYYVSIFLENTGPTTSTYTILIVLRRLYSLAQLR